MDSQIVTDQVFGKAVLGSLHGDHVKGESEILILRNETSGLDPKMPCSKLNSE